MAAASRSSASSRGVSTPAAVRAITADSSASRTEVWASGRRMPAQAYACAGPDRRPAASCAVAASTASASPIAIVTGSR